MDRSVRPFSLTPLDFLTLSCSCRYFPHEDFKKLTGKTYQLPATSLLALEEKFADVAMGWNEEGLYFSVRWDWPLSKPVFPEVSSGDSFEVFVNTRTANIPTFNNRYCHHFFAFLQSVDGRNGGEITRFRTEDAHPLCSPEDLRIDCEKIGRHHQLWVKIPKTCLQGFDPESNDHLGFTYRINRYMAPAQHFAASGRDFSIEQQPKLWGLLRLIR